MVAWPAPMTEAHRPIAAIVLAAGKGTRMKSATMKVLHPIAGRPMIEHLLASLGELEPERTVVVIGEGREQMQAALGGRVELAVQEPQLGTGHAVQQAEAALGGFRGDVLIMYGDVPLVRPQTMRAMVERLRGADEPAVVVLGFTPADPLQYGRVIARDAESYRYLHESIRRFPAQRELAARMRAVGFERVAWRNMTLGIVALHSGWRI